MAPEDWNLTARVAGACRVWLPRQLRLACGGMSHHFPSLSLSFPKRHNGDRLGCPEASLSQMWKPYNTGSGPAATQQWAVMLITVTVLMICHYYGSR